jgi:hypothetical protein
MFNFGIAPLLQCCDTFCLPVTDDDCCRSTGSCFLLGATRRPGDDDDNGRLSSIIIYYFSIYPMVFRMASMLQRIILYALMEVELLAKNTIVNPDVDYCWSRLHHRLFSSHRRAQQDHTSYYYYYYYWRFCGYITQKSGDTRDNIILEFEQV